jgi:acetyl esterase/lipase
MPIGYLVSVLGAAVATALALSPRATRGPRATPAFVVESAANELPFLILYWLALSTVLAVAQGDIASPVGRIAAGIMLLTSVGVAVVVHRALQARLAIDTALARGIGDGWRSAIDPALSRGLRPHVPLGRVLIAPLRFPPRAVERTRNIAYGPAGRDNLLDLYRPRSRPARCPALIHFHPGGFFSGRKSRQSRPIIDQLVRSGWVCVSANYRLGDAGAFPNHLVDTKLVIAWLRAHAGEYGVDPDSIVVAGGSAGAHLAAMCALTANDPRFQPGFEDADTGVAATIGLYGYYGPASTAGPILSSPAEYVRADAPPFLVIHGARDPMVPAPEVRGFIERLRDASSSPVVYAELPGGQHNFDLFPSIRCAAVADGIEAFTAWVRSTRRRGA